MGFSFDKFNHYAELSHDYSIIFKFSSTESCHYIRNETRQELKLEQVVSEGLFLKRSKEITNFYWNFTISIFWHICLKGKGQEECEIVFNHDNSHQLMTLSPTSPRVELYHLPSINLDATWFFKQFNSSKFSSFQINRTNNDCFTPARNRQTHFALTYFHSVVVWTDEINRYFQMPFFQKEWSKRGGRSLEEFFTEISESLFVPVAPIMVHEKTNSSTNFSQNHYENPLFLTQNELYQCHSEEHRRIESAKHKIVDFIKQSNTSIFSAEQATVIMVLRHLNEVCESLVSGVISIEKMLENELFNAIGREVRPEEIREYMNLKGKQLFKERYRPNPMMYAVRRSSLHSSEGTVSLEDTLSSPFASPILHTVVRKERMAIDDDSMNTTQESDMARSVRPMSVALDDSTHIQILGERYIHGYLHYQFGNGHFSSSTQTLSLVAKARQFSCFIVLLGTISTTSSFNPTDAFIVQNMDVMKIPLEIEYIPSLKEFRRAISSLSPTQQQFAEAIRELQMSNTLFGVMILPIKSQLEKVLNLPPNSLSKEIALTENLLKLFIDYQIPSEMLAYQSIKENFNNYLTPVEMVRTQVQLIKVRQVSIYPPH